MGLSPELCRLRDEIRGYAVDYGLDFFEVIFELLDWKQINEVAAYGGFPNRYPHWRFGMEYERLSKSYAYGLSKIYEMVINNDPCYAYLLHSNHMVDQKLVMAHVYGHSDFFKNNQYFAHTNRKMMDEVANHRTRVLRYIDKVGYEKVERLIDACLSLETLIDYHGTAIRRGEERGGAEEKQTVVQKLSPQSRPYMDRYINPPEFLAEQKERLEAERKKASLFPENPQRDVLNFLIKYAPLEAWEADVLCMIGEETHYFAPQGMTKIMNEGWASFWHSKIMTEKALKDDEVIDYADHHSGTVAMQGQQLNPYKVGIELFRDIEERWNKGRFGSEYDQCTDMKARASWDTKLGLGREKIYEVRQIYNDVTFIDTFLTPEFCQRHRLFVYAYNISSDQFEVAGRTFDKIKQQLLFQLTNCGQPVIAVIDANYRNRGELVLKHYHDGIDLRRDYAEATLKNLFTIWHRPVHVDTVVEGVPKLMTFDGETYKETRP